VLPTVHRLRRDFPFDVIHAHVTYPDGVVAVLLGYLYGIPVIITEQATWLPWMHQQRLVRRQALWAARGCNAHIAVSQAVRDHISKITGDPEKVRVIPTQSVWLGNEYAALVGPVLRLNLQARLAPAQPGLNRPWTDRVAELA
jgi:hypothetical protein